MTKKLGYFEWINKGNMKEGYCLYAYYTGLGSGVIGLIIGQIIANLLGIL